MCFSGNCFHQFSPDLLQLARQKLTDSTQVWFPSYNATMHALFKLHLELGLIERHSIMCAQCYIKTELKTKEY